MSINSIPTLIGALSVLIIGLFVYFKNPKASVNIAFGLSCLSFFGWLFGYTIVYSAKETTLAMTGTRIACAFAAFVAPTFYHLVVSFLKKKNEEKMVWLAYIFNCIIFILFIFTDYLLTTPYKYSWGYYSHATMLHPLYLAAFFGVFLRGLYLLYINYLGRKKLSPKEATQSVYFFAAYLIAMMGAVDYIQKYGVDIYPFGWLFEVCFVFIMAYAITKTRLMDIPVIVSRSLAEVLTLFIFSVMYLSSAWLYIFYSSSFITPLFLAWSITYGAFVAQTHQSVRLKIQTSSDKLFLRGRYDYYKELSQASTEAVKTLSLSGVLRVLYKTFYEVIEAGSPRIFLPEDLKSPLEQARHYVVYDNTTFLPRPDSEKIKADDPLVCKLTLQRSPLINPKDPERQLVVPCLIEDRLIGFFMLGKKISEDPYTDKDIQLLEVLANQAAVSIENALATEELKKTQEELRKYAGTLEEKVKERTVELQAKLVELKEFHDLAVGRELKMMEMEKTIAELKGMPGQS